MSKRYDMQFKLDSVGYYEENKELGIDQCAINIGIASSTLRKWIKLYSCTNNIEKGVYDLKEGLKMTKNEPSGDVIADLLNQLPKLKDIEDMTEEYAKTVKPSTEKTQYVEEYAPVKPRKNIQFSFENYAYLTRAAKGLGVNPSVLINYMLDDIRSKYPSAKEFAEKDIYGLEEKFEEALAKKEAKYKVNQSKAKKVKK